MLHSLEPSPIQALSQRLQTEREAFQEDVYRPYDRDHDGDAITLHHSQLKHLLDNFLGYPSYSDEANLLLWKDAERLLKNAETTGRMIGGIAINLAMLDQLLISQIAEQPSVQLHSVA